MPTNNGLCYDVSMSSVKSKLTPINLLWVVLIFLLVVVAGLMTGEQRNGLTVLLSDWLGSGQGTLLYTMQSVAPLAIWGHALVHLVLSTFALFVMGSVRALVSLVIIGLMVELAQYFVPGRVPSLGDLWVNLSATLAVVVLYFVIRAVTTRPQVH